MSDRPRRPAPNPRPNRTSKPSLRNQLLMILGIVALAAGAFYTALVVATQIDHVFFPGKEIRLGKTLSTLPGIESGSAATSEDPTGRRINVLVMGLDRRPTDGDAPSRSDTMFVMSIDPVTKTARGLAMPRDLWVDIPLGKGQVVQDRINTAYAYGGVDAVKATVEKLLGINVDYYVMIDFEGFKQIINLLGGVDVHVPDGLGVDDPYYSETERLGDYYPCVFPPGDYHMDGSQALCYSRVRRNSDDRERIIRQQTVIYAVIDKAAQLDMLSSAKNIVNLWKRYKDTVKTDISDLQIAGFADLAVHVDRDNIAIQSLGAVTTPYTIPQTGAQVLLPSQEGIKEMVQAFLSDGKLQAEAATVEVLDGTGVDGQAGKALDLFASLGIPQSSLTVEKASSPTSTTQVINFSGKDYTASRLAGALNLPASSVRPGTAADESLRTNNADIVVVLGADAKLDTALRAPVAATPGP